MRKNTAALNNNLIHCEVEVVRRYLALGICHQKPRLLSHRSKEPLHDGKRCPKCLCPSSTAGRRHRAEGNGYRGITADATRRVGGGQGLVAGREECYPAHEHMRPAVRGLERVTGW